jgi:radical SAM protein with 4Fe4S-binding SPASM domain
MRTLEPEWDVIVIGAGLGGLSAAATLAHRGLHVLVLEQHVYAGGYAHHFLRRVRGTRTVYDFDVALHQTGDLAPGRRMHAALAEIGVLDRIELIRFPVVYRTRGPTHDLVVGRVGAFQRTVQGIRNLRAAGIRVHTNTTINRHNRNALHGLIDLVAELGSEHLSMNMVIRTGDAVGQTDIGYADIGPLVLDLKQHAEDKGLKFIWYSPVPFCLFNPAAYGLGSPSCSAADGLLSIAPDGGVLPCSSFEQGVGNLLQEDFDAVWNRRSARYWRDKEFLPPGCRACEYAELCCGACPLYWDEQKTFAEIADHLQPAPPWADAVWRVKRRVLGQVKGVGVK